MKQLDEATRWMVDNVETYAPTWPAAVLRETIGTYVAHARAVAISERGEDRKAELLTELTDLVWAAFGSRGWRRGPRLLLRSVQRLEATIVTMVAETDRQHAAAPES
ncbi:hypothetical protein [Streptomyces sp. B3I8]|uniref:hypothetical protein n=1 Tax=Streptomyces sp. B3I8 TaxID=3042303 RepID=UPI00278814B6|nr:hypothetical protein [Streptomyces sp. B3I8]MDQ0790807.1 hypothetical protein [Streptomyces sp. B3I8]